MLIFPSIFALVYPLTYLRFAASDPTHFLHKYTITQNEKFLQNTRDNLPTFFKPEGLFNFCTLLYFQRASVLNKTDSDLTEIPSLFFKYWLQSLLFLTIYDCFTYWSHRMVHLKRFYFYHKQHHTVRSTVAISLIDTDILDYFINNFAFIFVPYLLYFIDFKMVYNLWIVIMAFFTWQGFMIHCDFKVIGVRKSLGLCWNETIDHHSYHHSINIGNYGFCAPQIWDWLCNTEYHWFINKKQIKPAE